MATEQQIQSSQSSGDLGDLDDLVDEVIPGEPEEGAPADKPDEKPADGGKDEDDGEIPDDLNLGDESDDDDDHEVPTEEDIEAYEDKSKAQAACKAMRKVIVDLKKNGTGGEAAVALQARVDELEAKEAGTDLSQTAAYKENYVKPIQVLGTSIQAVGNAKSVELTILRQALIATDSKTRLDLLKSGTDDNDTILELIPMMNEMDKLRGDASKAITDAQSGYKESIATKATADAEVQTALMESTLSELGKVHFLLRDSAKSPKWMEGIKAAAGSIIDGSAKPEDVVTAALKAQVSDHYLAMFSKEREARIKAENDIDKLRGVRPRNDAAGSGDKGGKGGKGATDLSKIDSIDALAGL